MSILARCEDGRATAHEWSRPDPRYVPGDTEAKLEQALTAAGPRTCAHIERHLGFTGCAGCPSRGQVKSPIVLGRLASPVGTVEGLRIRTAAPTLAVTTTGPALPVMNTTTEVATWPR
jgi:hypothetical protein